MAILNMRLPVDVEQGARGGPRWKTVINVSSAGTEQRIAEWDQARAEYDIQYGIKDVTDAHEVLQFFRATMGPLHPFRFKDWSDFKNINQLLGTGDGATTEFPHIMTYSDPGALRSHIRTNTLPVSGTVVIKVNNVTQTENTHYTVDYGTGLITFVSPPANGHEIRITCDFDVPVRFEDDYLEIQVLRADENADDTHAILVKTGSIKLVEVLSE